MAEKKMYHYNWAVPLDIPEEGTIQPDSLECQLRFEEEPQKWVMYCRVLAEENG